MWLILIAYITGLVVAVIVTGIIHHGVSNSAWHSRFEHTRLRWGDLPIGGFVFVLAGISSGLDLLISAGIGMTIGALGWGIIDPLERFKK